MSYFENQNIPINAENVFTLHQLADYYDVKSLKKLINDFINLNQSLFSLSKLFANGNITNDEEALVAKNLISYLNNEEHKQILLSLPIFVIDRILLMHRNKNSIQNEEDEEKMIENETKIMNFMLDYLKEKGISASPIFASIDFIHVGKECVNRLLNEFVDIFDFTFIANKMARILAWQLVETDIQRPTKTSNTKTSDNDELDDQNELNRELKRRINENESSSTFEIPSGLKSINEPYYVCSNVTSIVITESVVYINESAFKHCSSLIEDKFISDRKLQLIGDFAFYGCAELINIKIQSTVKYIGKSTFSGCKKLKEITIPDLVTSIEERTFTGCSSLSKIILGSSITRIKGPYFFYLCRSLNEINIPSSVEYIEDSAFIGCPLVNVKILKNAYIEGTTFDSLVNVQREL